MTYDSHDRVNGSTLSNDTTIYVKKKWMLLKINSLVLVLVLVLLLRILGIPSQLLMILRSRSLEFVKQCSDIRHSMVVHHYHMHWLD